MVPADDQATVFPCASVMVIIVLLKVAFTCATPDAMFLRSRRRTRAGSFPSPDPLKDAALCRECLFLHRANCEPDARASVGCGLPANLLLLARYRLGWTLARAGIGVGTLAADGQPTAMSQPTVASEIHQPLDVHGHLTSEIAFHHVVSVNDFPDLEHFLVGELGHPPRFRNSDFVHDFIGLFWPDSMDILKRDNHTLVGWYIDAGNAGHSSSLLLGQAQAKTRHPSPAFGARHRSTLQLGCGLLMDSIAFRQPPSAPVFARGSFARGGSGPAMPDC